jgi:hypothetical protein
MSAWRVLGFGIALLVLAAGVAVAVALSGPGKAAPKPPPPAGDDKAAKDDLNDLSMEVAALETIHDLQLTPAQLDELARLAKTDGAKDQTRKPAKAGDKVRKALADLRAALIADNDDRIEELAAARDELIEKESPDLDDDFEITDAARKHAPEFLRRLTAAQVAAYLAERTEDLTDPMTMLAETIEQSRKLSGEEWDDARDDAADELGWIVAGADADGAAKVAVKVKELIDRAHKLKDAEFTAQREELDKAARQIAGDLGPTDVIRHFLERALAELLSNPRLAAAVEARTQKGK